MNKFCGDDHENDVQEKVKNQQRLFSHWLQIGLVVEESNRNTLTLP